MLADSKNGCNRHHPVCEQTHLATRDVGVTTRLFSQLSAFCFLLISASPSDDRNTTAVARSRILLAKATLIKFVRESFGIIIHRYSDRRHPALHHLSIHYEEFKK